MHLRNSTKEPEERYSNQVAYEKTYDVSEDYFDAQINELSLEEIDTMLSDEETQSIEQTETHSEDEYDSELVDEILKEIEMEKK